MQHTMKLEYWMLSNMFTGTLRMLTLNPPHTPDHTLLKWTTSHPVPSVAVSKASSELNQIQEKKEIWFCGASQGYGFHEDGLKEGPIAAQGMTKRTNCVLNNHKHMVLTWLEKEARLLITRFFKSFITTGCIMLKPKATKALPMHLFMGTSLLLIRTMPSDEARRLISPMDARRSCDDNDLNDNH
ncbi:hypothetical protein FXO38_28951 [Capsicum annuum]|nr:hypothetical protein FXO37_34775 [Capsicum annuum]KAF3627032.1 hypothetical protein FXO38_28951 [Capsicum annuum]